MLHKAGNTQLGRAVQSHDQPFSVLYPTLSDTYVAHARLPRSSPIRPRKKLHFELALVVTIWALSGTQSALLGWPVNQRRRFLLCTIAADGDQHLNPFQSELESVRPFR